MDRRGRLAAAVVATVLLLGAGAGAWWVLGEQSDDDGVAAGADAGTTPPTSRPPATAPTLVTSTTVDPATLVELDDVWLLDGGDGSYAWGLVIVGGDQPRRDIDVTVRLRDATGSVVFTASDVLRVLGANQRSAIGGTARSLQAQPVRIETDVSVGFALDGAGEDAAAGGADVDRVGATGATGAIDVRAVERRVDPRSNDGREVIAGRLRSSEPEPVEGLRLTAIWRAPADGDGISAGDVVAVLYRDVDRVRPGVDARFEIPVTGLDVPDGAPDEILVTI